MNVLMKLAGILRNVWAVGNRCIQLAHGVLTKRDYRCSFCGKHKDEVAVIIDGPGVMICDGCVRSYTELSKDTHNGEKTEPHTECSFCSFLSEMRASTPKFMQPYLGPPVGGRRLFLCGDYCICDDCLDLCNEIIVEKQLSQK